MDLEPVDSEQTSSTLRLSGVVVEEASSLLQSEDRSVVSRLDIGCKRWEDIGDEKLIAHRGSSNVDPRGCSVTSRTEGTCS